MRNFKVRLYPVVLVCSVMIEADTPEEAIKKAKASLDLKSLLSQEKPSTATGVEYTEFSGDYLDEYDLVDYYDENGLLADTFMIANNPVTRR